MIIIPNSKIKLIKNPLKLDQNNEMTFSNATAQYNYFTSLPKLEFDNLTYVRKDGVLRVETDDNLTYEDLLEYNFCMYQNTHFSNKWFYAFITEITWINPSMTELKLETAYFQTWQFDLVYKDSFIEREHVNDDTIGKNTIAENLEIGEYIYQNAHSGDVTFNYLLETHFVVALSDWPFDSTIPNNLNMYNGVFSGFIYLAFNSSTDLSNFIHDLQSETANDVIYSIFVIPASLDGLTSADFTTIVTGKTWHACWIPRSTGAIYMGGFSIVDNHVLDTNFVPKNNKMLCYPFRYILINNNSGSSMDYRYEWFLNKQRINNLYYCDFGIYGIISPGCSIKIYPVDYNQHTSLSDSLIYGVDAGKLPTCSWWNDSYTNWLTQNAVNIPLQTIGNVSNAINGLATGNISGVTSGISGIANQVGEMYAHSLEPATGKGGVNQGDLNFSRKQSYNVYRVSIREEYAKVCDDFLTMFGYKVNRVGLPHLHVRQYYDFIKTIDVNIEGDIPENDLNEIRKMFNNGIRFWHNTTYYLDFSVNNSII